MYTRSLLLVCLLLSAAFVSAAPFDVDKAQSYLFYAYGAYCNESALATWQCKWCDQPGVSAFQPYSFPNNTRENLFSFVGYDPDNNTVVISFRGTQDASLKNWILDLYFPKKVLYNGTNNNDTLEVHSGFYHGYKQLAPDVRSSVRALLSIYPSASVSVTGHSLGAALSVLCALDLVEQGITTSNQMIVYNFGDPRVGNEGFANYYNSKIPLSYRMVNARDIVPSLPPRILNFYHVATEVWEHGNRYKVCDGTGEDPTCSDSVISWSPKDHTHYMGYETCECKTTC